MTDLDALGVDAHPVGDRALEGDRHVAQPDGPIAAIDQRLGHDPDRVGEVDDPGVRRAALRRDLGQVEDDRYGPHRLGQAPGTGRLLADRAEADRNRLVQEPRRLPADAELDQHEAGAVDGGLDVTGQRQAPPEPEAGEHATGHAADHGAALFIDVVEDELLDGQPVMALRQTLDQLRGVGAPAADDRDLDPHQFPRRDLTPIAYNVMSSYWSRSVARVAWRAFSWNVAQSHCTTRSSGTCSPRSMPESGVQATACPPNGSSPSVMGAA